MSMNVRIKSFKNKDGTTRNYLYIVENYKENGKPKQKNLLCLGRVENINDKEQLDKLIKALSLYSKEIKAIKIKDEISASWAKVYGPIPIFRYYWEKLGLDKIFERYAEKNNYQFDPKEAIFSLICNHLIEPRSERGTFYWKEDVYEPKWDDLNLHHYYRALDFLIEHKDRMEMDIFRNVVDLFNLDLDLIMFDTTTLIHWGEGKYAEILKHGFSKDKRGDLKQIMVGILMTKDGYPIGHQVFPGDLGDINAFERALDMIKRKFRIGRVIIVCDRGMISKKNLEEIKKLDYQYIIGVRMRKLDQKMREKLLSKEDFDVVKEGKLWVKEVMLEDGRYIVCHNPEEAEYEKRKREYFKEILQNKIESRSIKDWVVKNGYRKYITIKNAEIILDEEKLEQEEIYDGMWVLLTNSDLSSREVASYYKGLWQIEQGFRELKYQLETGPVYHWKERRILAHVFVCFLALIIKTAFRKALQKMYPEVLYSDVMDALKRVKVTKVNLDNSSVFVRTELSPIAALAYRACGIRPPKRVLDFIENSSVKAQDEFQDDLFVNE